MIVGGGGVAARKARGLIEAGATKVRMVSPSFHKDVPGAVERVAERYEARHLEGAGLVFAATDSGETNDAVVADARRLGILVSRADADEGEPGDFSTPAVVRKGALTVMVSAAGAPALAAMVRDQLAGRIDPRWREMAEAMQAIRPAVRGARGMTAERRREAFLDLATEEAMVMLAGKGTEGLWRWLVEKYPELV